jgi:hypothetical protein
VARHLFRQDMSFCILLSLSFDQLRYPITNNIRKKVISNKGPAGGRFGNGCCSVWKLVLFRLGTVSLVTTRSGGDNRRICPGSERLPTLLPPID